MAKYFHRDHGEHVLGVHSAIAGGVDVKMWGDTRGRLWGSGLSAIELQPFASHGDDPI
jgi:hypothetical protein